MNIAQLIRIAAAVIAAGAAAWVVYYLVRTVRFETSATKHLRSFSGDSTSEAQGRAGERIAKSLPLSLETWQNHMLWAQRGGHYEGKTFGNIIFNACLYAGVAFALMLVFRALILILLPVLAFMFPLIAMRSKANKTRRLTVRALPDVASLVAAEVSAGTTAEQAVERATVLPGPLADLLKEANTVSRDTNKPLFSREGVPGSLVLVFSRTQLPALRAFALQIDEVANKGVDSAELMTTTARSLAREYRDRVMTEKEKLDGTLTTNVAFFFFFPAVLLIMAAFLIPLIGMF